MVQPASYPFSFGSPPVHAVLIRARIGFRVLNFAKARSVAIMDETVAASTHVRMTDIDDGGDCEEAGIEAMLNDSTSV